MNKNISAKQKGNMIMESEKNKRNISLYLNRQNQKKIKSRRVSIRADKNKKIVKRA